MRKKETGRENEMFCSWSISDNAPQEEGYTIEVVKPANIAELGGGSSLVMQCTSKRIHIRGKETMLAYHVQHVRFGISEASHCTTSAAEMALAVLVRGMVIGGRSRSPALMRDRMRSSRNVVGVAE